MDNDDIVVPNLVLSPVGHFQLTTNGVPCFCSENLSG